MALLLSGERPSAAAMPFSPLRFLTRSLAKMLVGRRQQRALGTLLAMDSHRLDDLGITRRDLFDAMQQEPNEAARTLTERRARRARA
jgi:uncharacterized protein YjiS (DUF1127 family)